MAKTRLFVKFSITVTAIIFLTCLMSANAFSEKVFKFKMGTWAPRGIVYEKILYDKYCDLVKQMSDGRIIIEVAYDGEGYSAKELMSAVKTGLIEMGEFYLNYYAGQFPAGVVEVGLPGGPDDMASLIYMYYHTDFRNVLEKAYNAQKLHVLGEVFWPKPMTITKEKINSIEDFKNIKIRAPGSYGKMFRNLGATPVALTFSEMYSGAATGVINAVGGPPLSDYRDAKLHEVLKYIYPTPISASLTTTFVINLEKYNKLPNDLKTILTVASRWIGIEIYYQSKIIEKEAVEEMTAAGVQFSPDPSKKDIQAWKEAGRKIWQDYAKDEFSTELINIQKNFLNKYQ